jgi:hypothetical protein
LVAQLGEALLAVYEPEGAQRLEEALSSAKSLAARDPGNSGFVLTEIIVLRYFIGGLAAWAEDPSATITERRSRVDRAQEHLARADQLIGGLRAESARRVFQFEYEPVRADLAKAKAKLEQSIGVHANP